MFLKLYSTTANILFTEILFILLTIGCSPRTSPPHTTTPTFSKFLPPTWTATITFTSSPTIISTFTQTITPTMAPTSTPTITQTLPPSLTPLPTVSFDSAGQAFEVLLA